MCPDLILQVRKFPVTWGQSVMFDGSALTRILKLDVLCPELAIRNVLYDGVRFSRFRVSK